MLKSQNTITNGALRAASIAGLALVASAALGLVGCNTDPREDSGWSLAPAAAGQPLGLQATTAGLQRRYDGETLFRGIYFGKGPVAEALPGLGAQKTTAALASPEQQEHVVAFVQNSNPTFFTSFAADVQSGNAARLERSLASASELIKAGTAKPALAQPIAANGEGLAEDEITVLIDGQVVILDNVLAEVAVFVQSAQNGTDPLSRAVALEQLASLLSVA